MLPVVLEEFELVFILYHCQSVKGQQKSRARGAGGGVGAPLPQSLPGFYGPVSCSNTN